MALYVPVEKTKKKKQQQQQARAAILWTLCNAVIVTIISLAFVPCYHKLMTHPVPPSWLLQRPVEIADALTLGILRCAATQAAAGGLALMLPYHRHRRLCHFLAYVALVATVLSHGRLAALHLIFVACDHLLWTVGAAAILIVEVGNFLCFLGLRPKLVLLGGEWKE